MWGNALGFKRVEVTMHWRKLRNEEVYNLFSPNIVVGLCMKSRRMR
jgi:hypothetical protein